MRISISEFIFKLYNKFAKKDNGMGLDLLSIDIQRGEAQNFLFTFSNRYCLQAVIMDSQPSLKQESDAA